MTHSKKSWIRPTVLLCTYGFFTYVKPSEPFITPYLMGPRKNLTEEEVVNAIYPVWVYSYLALLLPVFLLTDYFKHKPVIVLQSFGYIACWILLVFAQGVPLMQLMQFFYGIATAGEIGYYSYIYSIVEPEKYQQVTSYVRATALFGLFFGSLVGQLLVSLLHIDYIYLNVLSLVNVTIGFFIALFLPMPERSLFFSASNTDEETAVENMLEQIDKDSLEELELSPPQMVAQSQTIWHEIQILWKDIKICYTNVVLLRWSAWWALSTCGWLLVVNYIQNLWETIQPSSKGEVYNGAVECIATMLGALGAISVGYIKLNWGNWGELTLGLCSVIKCGLLMLMCRTENIWLCYFAYIFFIFLYNFVITIAQFRLAVGLTTKRFALVFGANTFAALAINTVLTIIIIDRVGFGLDVNTQFVVYSGYFGIIAIVFLAHGIFHLITANKEHSKQSIKTHDPKKKTENTQESTSF